MQLKSIASQFCFKRSNSIPNRKTDSINWKLPMISILLLSNRAEPWKSSVLTATASNIYLNVATSILIQRPISSSWRSVDSDLIISTRKIANAHLNIAVTSRFSCKFWKITTCWHWNWHWNSIGSIAAVFDCLAQLENLKHFRPVPPKLPENAAKMLLKMFHFGTSFNQFLHFWSKNCNSTGNWHIFGPFGPIQLQINPIQNRLNAIFGSCWIWLDTLRPFSSFVVDSFWIQFRRGFENLKNGRRRSASKTSLSSFVGFPILWFNSVHFYRFCFVFIDIIVSFFFETFSTCAENEKNKSRTNVKLNMQSFNDDVTSCFWQRLRKPNESKHWKTNSSMKTPSSQTTIQNL